MTSPIHSAPQERPDDLLPAREVRRINGDISEITLWRWVRDGKFPKPVKFNGRNYWRRADARIDAHAQQAA